MLLKQTIQESSLTPAQWAIRLGISRPHMSTLMSGKRKPSLDLAVRIERATNGAVPAESWIIASDGAAA